jgi:hypothetical protein
MTVIMSYFGSQFFSRAVVRSVMNDNGTPTEAIALAVAAPIPRKPPLTKTTLSKKFMVPPNLGICRPKSRSTGYDIAFLKDRQVTWNRSCSPTLDYETRRYGGAPALLYLPGFGATTGSRAGG